MSGSSPLSRIQYVLPPSSFSEISLTPANKQKQSTDRLVGCESRFLHLWREKKFFNCDLGILEFHTKFKGSTRKPKLYVELAVEVAEAGLAITGPNYNQILKMRRRCGKALQFWRQLGTSVSLTPIQMQAFFSARNHWVFRTENGTRARTRTVLV